MTDLERRALLGDTEAQRECTEKGIVLPCWRCGGDAAEHKFVNPNGAALRRTDMERLTGRRDRRAYIVGCPDFALPKIVGLIIQQTVDRLAAIEDILGDEYDLDELREMVQAKRDGRCVVLPFKPHKTMWSCSKSNPKPSKAYYATEMGILADMKAGCVFGETPEAAEAALAKEAHP